LAFPLPDPLPLRRDDPREPLVAIPQFLSELGDVTHDGSNERQGRVGLGRGEVLLLAAHPLLCRHRQPPFFPSSAAPRYLEQPPAFLGNYSSGTLKILGFSEKPGLFDFTPWPGRVLGAAADRAPSSTPARPVAWTPPPPSGSTSPAPKRSPTASWRSR